MRRRGPALGALAALVAAAWSVPVVTPHAPVGTVLVDRAGQLVGARIAADEQWRFQASGPVPERFAVALQVAEDRRFLSHLGVDPLAVGRAVVANLAAGEVVSGASTLTMQTIRISRGNPPRTLPEKVLEAVLALRLEASASKPEILAAYAHHAPFGGNTVGLEAAAWRYVGRPASDLSWAEAATLAVLPNSPGLIHPGRSRDRLKLRRDELLADMVEQGVLDEEDRALAVLEPLPGPARSFPRLAPHLMDRSAPGHHAITLDRTLQARVTEIAWHHHARLAANQVHNLAAVVIDVPTGEVRAWLGNVPSFDDPSHGHHVDVVTAPRSTGSLLKPFLYEAMLEAGELLPDQLVPDVPLRVGGFAPENFDRVYEGAIPASRALARSRNVPAVWMLREHGVDRFYGELRRLGMSTLHRPASDYGLALVLGGAEGSLLDLTGMYRRLALSALQLEGAPEVHWRAGDAAPLEGELLDAGASWQTLEALLEVNRPGVHGAWRQFDSGRPVAWKTGTSMGFRDAWAIAVTPAVAIGVWAGNADGEGRPELIGSRAAAPVLFDLLDLVETGGWFEPPPDALVEVELCADSGMRASADCPHTHWQRVPRTGLRGTSCTTCQRVHCDEGCAHRVHAACAAGEDFAAEPFFVLPPGQAWFYARRNAAYRELPPWREDCRPDHAERDQLTCLYPREDAHVRVPTELDGTQGRVVFEASHRDPQAVVHWHLDGAFVRSTEDIHQLALAPAPGRHELVLVDGQGATAVRRFEVVP